MLDPKRVVNAAISMRLFPSPRMMDWSAVSAVELGMVCGGFKEQFRHHSEKSYGPQNVKFEQHSDKVIHKIT